MNDPNLSVSLQDIHGMKPWEMKDFPPPNEVEGGMATYRGQKYIENLMKILNQKVYQEHDERLLPYIYEIFEKSIEYGVEDEGTILWDDRSHYTRISWTGYSWKLPNELKRRKVKVRISKLEDEDINAEFKVPLTKIANDGGDILIAPRLVSKMNLKKGNQVSVRMCFTG